MGPHPELVEGSPHRPRIGAGEKLHFAQKVTEMLGMGAGAAAENAAASCGGVLSVINKIVVDSRL